MRPEKGDARVLIGKRDRDLLVALYRFQAMAREQVQALFFPSLHRTNKRLKRLLDAGLVRRSYPVLPCGLAHSAQGIYAVGTAAAPWLSLWLDEDPAEVARRCRAERSAATLAHTLAVVDFYLRLRRATEEGGACRMDRFLAESECTDEYEVRTAGEGAWRRQILRPDGYALLARPGGERRHSFVEIDRGTVSSRLFAKKVDSYRLYAESGMLEATYGSREYAVLVVTTGELRLAHLREIAAGRGGAAFLFATAADVERHGPFQAIWRPAASPGRVPPCGSA